MWFCQRDPTLVLLVNPSNLLWKMQLDRAEMVACPSCAVDLATSISFSDQQMFLLSISKTIRKLNYLEVNEIRNRGGTVDKILPYK